MARVVITNLVKQFPHRAGNHVSAVDRISLTIEDGEFMVLVGPSGCGKTTTLRMIAGLETVDSGTITIDGRLVNDVPPKDRDLAMVFQNYALYPHMSVHDNLAFGLKLRGVPRAEADARVRSAAALLGLEALLDRRPRALSGGQRQRVAVGRAIVRQPKVFLFDEPLSNLDAQMRVSMRAEISKLHARLGTTMIYVTHDQVEAMTMGDRICVMKDGRIMQVADPQTLYHQPANLFTAGFIGSPPMNFLRGVVTGAGTPCFEESGGAGAPLRLHLDGELARRGRACAGRPVILGIRPEHLHDARGADPGPLAVADLKVDLSELLGAETHVTLDTGAHRLVCRVRSRSPIAVGSIFRVAFELGSAHLFDPDSGGVIT